jgi:Trk K+ transport system NAD-binding subunit
MLTLVGTAFVAVLYALFTERLLTLRFQFFKRRPPIPPRDHVIIVGLGRVGCRVVNLLHRFQQPLVGLASTQAQFPLPIKLPVIEGPITKSFSRTNLATAKTVVAVTEREMENLEMALSAHAVNPGIGLVIRTYRRRFRDTVARLFPYAQVLCASELSAEAFVAAAFGERVISLFRWHNQTVLVTDYEIEAGDTLNGKLLAEIAYGYGVVPVYHERPGRHLPSGFPSNDVRLQEGDRLVVLATIQGLEQIENGTLNPPTWQLELQSAFNQNALVDGAATLARVGGCSLMTAQELLHNLPSVMPNLLYEQQAYRLVRELRSAQIKARAIKPGA